LRSLLRVALTLVEKEQRQFQMCPSLREFCRVDVGLIQAEGGWLEYFVNEVECSINVCLWAGALRPERAGLIEMNLAKPFHSWILGRKNISR
jgi:hypothetical protein